MLAQLRPFQLHVEDAVLDDLHDRLRRTRWPDEPPGGAAWQYGADLGYLRELVAYWRDAYDWRAQEQRLNAWPQYTATVRSIDLHLVHVQGVGLRPLPLLLSHGWPGSVWEFHKLIPLLTDPARFGADPADAFSVVAPSLPGYAWAPAMADVLAELMSGVLVYTRFGAQGGDWGAFISAALGLDHR